MTAQWCTPCHVIAGPSNSPTQRSADSLRRSRQVFHSGPGNTFAIDDKHRDRRELLKAQAIIKDRCSRDIWRVVSVLDNMLSAVLG